jgi:hypothetical protein
LEPVLATLNATLVFVEVAKGSAAQAAHAAECPPYSPQRAACDRCRDDLASRISAACHAAPLDAAMEFPVFVCLVSPRDYWPPKGRDLGVIGVPRGVFGAVLIPAEGGAGLVRANGQRIQKSEILEHLRDAIASGGGRP